MKKKKKRDKTRREVIQDEIDDLECEIDDLECEIGEAQKRIRELYLELDAMDAAESAEIAAETPEHRGRTYMEDERLICTEWFDGCPRCARVLSGSET